MDPVLYAVRSKFIQPPYDEIYKRPIPAGLSVGGPAPEEQLNLVFVFLESVGSDAVTHETPGLATTPFLNELSGRSLTTSRNYTIMTSTYKSHIAALCGVEPFFIGDRELYHTEYDFDCLPEVLGAVGYRSAYFSSSGRTMLHWHNLVANLGFDDFFAFEDMATDGFEDANAWAYEDDIMLEPSETWLRAGTGPFVVAYMPAAPHYEYLGPRRYGRHHFLVDDGDPTTDEETTPYNLYLNAVHYTDHFVANLFEQYERLGLMDDTVFVLFGDHGEGFGQHLPLQHNANPYEESLRTPLWIYQRGKFPGGQRADGLTTQLDILPTVAEMMRWTPDGVSDLDGLSLLGDPSHDEVFAACLYQFTCSALIAGSRKYIHHFGERPDELFDLSTDPAEKNDIIDDNRDEAEQMRRRVQSWYLYGDPDHNTGHL